MSLFSVVVPSFNRVEFLRNALGSVFSQWFREFEVIVVDDGSTDGTWDYLQSLEPQVKRFRQVNRGPGAARNLGACQATGTYLAFLDSDDVWFPWTLEVYRNVLRDFNAPAFLAGKPYIFSGNNQ